LRIDAEQWAAVVAHLRAALPNEGCGLLAVAADEPTRVVAFFPGDNIDASPTRYTMSPATVLAAFREMDERGWRLGAIVHAHPVTPATPSPTDLREAFYPSALMVIVSFAGETPVARAWAITAAADGGEERSLTVDGSG
jgi:proteasome lid subunit RPN8/RPN11